MKIKSAQHIMGRLAAASVLAAFAVNAGATSYYCLYCTGPSGSSSCMANGKSGTWGEDAVLKDQYGVPHTYHQCIVAIAAPTPGSGGILATQPGLGAHPVSLAPTAKSVAVASMPASRIQ